MTLLTNEHNNMAISEASNVSLQQQHTNPTVDTVSLISLTSAQMQAFLMMELERGPRFQAYAELRERKLRMKYTRQQEYEEEEEGVEVEVEAKVLTPPRKKQVKFQGGVVSGRKGSSLLAQSVPDFSAALRKENRKPVNGNNMLPPLMELTPPSKSSCGVLSSARGSKSANAGEKKRGGGGILMPRKSYASIDELKSLSSAAVNAINGESRGGGRTTRVITRKSVLGYRQHF